MFKTPSSSFGTGRSAPRVSQAARAARTSSQANAVTSSLSNDVGVETKRVTERSEHVYCLTSDIKLVGKPVFEGAYGRIYNCTIAGSSKLYIAKHVPLDHTGIPNPIEPAIMSSLEHPNLIRTIRNVLTRDGLYMIQEKAHSDLAKFSQKHPPSIDLLRDWTIQIIRGLYALHDAGIIHGDLKADNLLLYLQDSTHTVKIGDFTLATKCWDKKEFNHKVCTPTHEPLECLLGQKWSFPLDIWSLGCTLYELAYGQKLFPGQSTTAQKVKSIFGQVKPLLAGLSPSGGLPEVTVHRFINAQYDWAERRPDGKEDLTVIKSRIGQDFTPFTLHPRFHDPEMKEFNNLILDMLRLNPAERSTMSKIAAHEFFGVDLKLQPAIEHTPTFISDLTDKMKHSKDRVVEQVRLSRAVMDKDKAVLLHAQKLFVDSYRSSVVPLIDEVRFATCIYLASKLITGAPIKIDVSLANILQAERIIAREVDWCILGT